MNGACKYHQISITKSISNIFKPNFVCFLTQMKDIKHIRQDFHSVAWGGGGGGGSKNKFPEYGHVAYQINGNDQ